MRTLLSLLLAVGLIASCGVNSDDVSTPGDDPTAVSQPTTTPAPDPTVEPAPTDLPAATTTPVPAATPVATTEPTEPPVEPTDTPVPAVDGDLANVYWLRATSLAAGQRNVEPEAARQQAIEQLLGGPNATETSLGMSSAIPAGTTLLGIVVDAGTATIDLSGEFESGSLGTSGELALAAQIVFTLTHFDTIDTVDFVIDGEVRDVMLSHGLQATGLTRADFYDAVAPGIVVESPGPGATVQSPFEVTGFSRTFESNVQYEITAPPGGAVVASGFTTAIQPDVGVHGPFSIDVELDASATGAARLTVFEESAKDGSRVNVYEVPITIGTDADTGTDWLRVNGLGPIDFGTSAADAQAIVTARFGDPIEVNDLGECPGGAATLVGYEDFTLLMSEGTFDGWFYRSSVPALTTPSGVAPGMSRAELETVYAGVVIEESTLGQEFFFEVPAGFIGGFLTDDGQTVTTLYAGTTCFFR